MAWQGCCGPSSLFLGQLPWEMTPRLALQLYLQQVASASLLTEAPGLNAEWFLFLFSGRAWLCHLPSLRQCTGEAVGQGEKGGALS